MLQSPLLQTAPSLSGLAQLRERPRVIMIGIGLGSRTALSEGLPFDTLGMLLAAEQLRRALGTPHMIALIADRHALSNGFLEGQVRARAVEVHAQLRTIQRALRIPLQVVRADTLHQTAEHRQVLAQVQVVRRAREAHPYMQLEVADTECLRRIHGPLLKLGWALGSRVELPCGTRDERAFDASFRAWIGTGVGFAYVAAGRTLDSSRPFAAPYLVLDPPHRLLLSRNERADEKLSRFLARAPQHARCRVLGHLRRITRVYSGEIVPLRGSVPQRVRGVLAHIYDHEHAA
ncbi:MAG TPA: hypothetical protein VFX59_17845 [Polyangiales bacterium]|nr:hypothetical protein [Polyangiales bacterium]